MAPRFAALLALAPMVAGAADGFPDMASMHSKCYSLLTDLSASQYSTDELALHCRANLPMEVCRAEAKELGAKPWSPSTIGRVCGEWEEDWTRRALQMTLEERRLDDNSVDEAKAKAGDVKDAAGEAAEDAKQKAEDVGLPENLGDAVEGAQDAADDAAEAAKQKAEGVGLPENLGDAVEGATDAADDAAEAAKQKAEDVTENLGDAAEDAKEKAGDAFEDANDKIKEATGQFEMFKLGRDKPTSSSTNPFMLLAAGAAVLGVASFAAVASFKRAMSRRAALSEVESDVELSQTSS